MKTQCGLILREVFFRVWILSTGFTRCICSSMKLRFVVLVLCFASILALPSGLLKLWQFALYRRVLGRRVKEVAGESEGETIARPSRLLLQARNLKAIGIRNVSCATLADLMPNSYQFEWFAMCCHNIKKRYIWRGENSCVKHKKFKGLLRSMFWSAQ